MPTKDRKGWLPALCLFAGLAVACSGCRVVANHRARHNPEVPWETSRMPLRPYVI